MPDVRGKEVEEEEEEEMEPETARRMWEEGGFLVVTHLLPGTEFGVDLRSCTCTCICTSTCTCTCTST